MFFSCGPVKTRTVKDIFTARFAVLWPTVSGFMAQFKFYRPIKGLTARKNIYGPQITLSDPSRGFSVHSRAIDTILFSDRII
ncbi:hypothetical protein CRN79_11265 [Serratia fonticola]|nr:hypothetical protein CRN79_11265 [Serratia fonticola]